MKTLTLVLMIAAFGCGKEAPRTTPPPERTTPEPREHEPVGRAIANDAPPMNASVALDTAATNDTTGALVDAGPEEVAAIAAQADAALVPRMPDQDALPGTGQGPERPPPSVLTPMPELCREACANARRLVLAELPEDTAKAMRDEVEKSLARDCHGRCLQRASIESARCFVQAKSALELAACQ